MRETLWSPAADALSTSRMGRWMSGQGFSSYEEAWAWSTHDLEGFWRSMWTELGIQADRTPDRLVAEAGMPGAVWCPGISLNYASHVLGRAGSVIERSQTRSPRHTTAADLADEVARVRAGLVALGVGRGDRVVAYMPNITETLVAFLATASLGAVWSSCPPEFGAKGVIDRFAQIEPRVLIAVDGYRHRGVDLDRRPEVAAIRAALPGLTAAVAVRYLGLDIPDAVTWEALSSSPGALAFEAVPFAHPLYVLYSSGTTGLPKPIVHGHGGILLEHLKMLTLHHGMGPGDRFFWYSTTGWMMWNYLVSGLAAGASIVLYDGDPAWPSPDHLWALAAEAEITHFGASAPYLLSCRKAGLDPGRSHDLSKLVEVGSTGAPLPAAGFEWVYEHVGADVRLASISGGTDVCTAFVGGAPVVAVVAGEISCRSLGAAVAAYDSDGRSVVGTQGNLVITQPMPSMPVGFWGDTSGARYRAAYFERFPGVWDHGDWITITERGTCVITGRSDSTLNRGGVRLGTSEFYAVIESMPEIADSLVVHLDDPEGGAGELLLFVQPAPGAPVDDALRERIKAALRANLSPRHVPDGVYEVATVPRTLSGKKLEIPVKRILMGTPAEEAAAKDALADPSSLEPFEALAAARAAS
jgi:acetoacetyl-CoA synthetase